MDTEVHFDWPEAGRGLPEEWRPLARRKLPRTPKQDPPADDTLRQELDEARETIARLEDDRRTARTLIGELEAANDELHARVTSQRRRLLLLERQLESADVQPAWQSGSPASWLDRLFGGLTSVPTG